MAGTKVQPKVHLHRLLGAAEKLVVPQPASAACVSATGPSIPIACHKNTVRPLQQKLELLLTAYSSSIWAFDTDELQIMP